MKRELLKGPDFYAVTEDGRLTEYIPEQSGEAGGDILLGRIGRLMKAMDCAFVDIGRKRHGFLPLQESGKTFQAEQPASGETLILQIHREETGEKGAYLTRDITLAGTCEILMPMNRYIGVSNRITDEEERERLKRMGREISGGRFGLVLRRSAAGRDAASVSREAEELFACWQEILKRAAEGGKPGTVLHHSGIYETLLHDYASQGVDAIRETDSLDAELSRQLAAAEERIVRLPGGGNIVIDRCEAMTVIDVNTASSTAAESREQTILQTNLAAAEEIAIQARLRDLAGIIIIDFIDMDSEKDRGIVLEKLKEAFSRDRIKTVVHGWTSLCLVEMTRKRR